MTNRNLIFGQKIVRTVVAPLIASSLIFGCNKTPLIGHLSTNSLVADLQLAANETRCAHRDGAVSFGFQRGVTLRDGQEIEGIHGDKIKIRVIKKPNGSPFSYLVGIVEPSGVVNYVDIKRGCID